MNRPATPEQVDAAIKAVLREFGWALDPDCGKIDGEFEVFAERLLTLKHLEMLESTTQEIRITPGTVVTPLAKEYLKRHRIQLRLVSEIEAFRSRLEGDWGFVIEETSGIYETLRRSLLSGGSSSVWREIGHCTLDAARWVSESRERGAVVLTAEASVACWLASQVKGVRSTTPKDANAITRAVRHLGANLLVFEPSGQSIHTIQHYCKIFRRSGVPRPPDWLEAGMLKRGGEHADRRGDWAGHVVESSSEYSKRSVSDRLAHASRGTGRGITPTW